jgi:hypothetical protein
MEQFNKVLDGVAARRREEKKYLPCAMADWLMGASGQEPRLLRRTQFEPLSLNDERQSRAEGVHHQGSKSMTSNFSREVGLLRTVAENLVSKPMPGGPITQEYLREQDMGRAVNRGQNVEAILRPGHAAFYELSASITDRFPAIARGTNIAIFESELFDYLIKNFLGRDRASVGPSDVSSTHAHLEAWFANLAQPRRVFVPCVISPWPAPRFSIGPVIFLFIEDAAKSEFYPRSGPEDILSRDGFDRMLQHMRDTRATWLARVPVEGCEQQRAEEIGNLAADVALVTLQLAAPFLGTKTMCRLDARRGAAEKRTLTETNGYYNAGWTGMDAGLAIGPGTLMDILKQCGLLIAAVGNCVQSFTTGQFRLPTLEQAWCDAAYWLHEALAEPMDSIAVAKLETALEVLFCAENPSGSQARILSVLDLFFSLKAEDPIMENSSVSAKQFARGIVNDRSRILHGTWSTLNSRLARNRGGLEGFVITVIRRTVLDLDEYCRSETPADSVDEFLAWIRSHPRA